MSGRCTVQSLPIKFIESGMCNNKRLHTIQGIDKIFVDS